MPSEFRPYLLAILASAIFGWGAFAIVMQKVGAYSSPYVAIPFFYATLFLALASTFAIFGYFLRVWSTHDPVSYRAINISIRQGAETSAVLCGALYIQHLGALTWWTGLLLIVISVIVEFYFVVNESS